VNRKASIASDNPTAVYVYDNLCIRHHEGGLVVNRCQSATPSLPTRPTGVGSGGYAWDLTPQLFMWRYWYPRKI